MRLRPSPSLLLAALLALGCGGGEAAKPIITPPAPAVVTTVNVSPSLASVELGSSLPLTADIRDQYGVVFPGKAATWTSGSTAIATVDAASGVVSGVSVGTATITATVDGKTGIATMNVFPLAVKSVTITAAAGPLTAGQTLALVVAVKDKNGGPLTGRLVTWSSSTPRVATVDGAGKVTALSGGTTTITGVSEGVSGSVALAVAPPAGSTLATIASVSPATLTPGAAATITGANFIAGAANDGVYIAGVAATITSASATQIAFTVPAAGLPCQSTQPVNVEVTTPAGTAQVKQPLAVATQRTLAVGASFMATASSRAVCNELPAAGTYLVSVFNAGTNLEQTAGFELTGSGGGASSAIAAPSAIRAAIGRAPRPAASAIDAIASAQVSEHLRRLEEGAQLRRQYGPPSRYRNVSRSVLPGQPGTVSRAPVPTVVGQTATVNFNYNSCRAGVSPVITARVVYVGPKAIVLEDNASPLAGKIDADMVALAQEFETVSYPLLLNFGDPLAYDAQTDANGRIIMLFTPKVNSAGSNLLGFVQSCDFYPPSAFASVSGSNQAEIFYARAVTDTSPSSTSLNGRPQWRRDMPSTLIHEAKHIVANAERNATPILTDNEEVWLEEATAQLASEMYGRAIHGNKWRSNASYFGTLDCEVRPNTAGCGAAIFVMGNHFGFLTDFLESFESKTILSGQDDNDIYGSSWLFTRWLVDTYGGNDESAFLHSIIRNFTQYGTENVSNAAGKSWPELLSQFTLMLAADDLAAMGSPVVEQSWNLPGVFAGYATDFPSSRPTSPLVPRTSAFGSFATTISSLKGGGAMLLRMSGPATATTQLFDLHAVGGGALPSTSNLGIAILRIQ
jgi:hypothetical protein